MPQHVGALSVLHTLRDGSEGLHMQWGDADDCSEATPKGGDVGCYDLKFIS